MMICDDDFIRGLPKAELHLHLEGSLEPDLLFQLAARNGVEIGYDTVESLRAAYSFESLQDFLDLYYQGMSVLLTQEDFHDLTLAYMTRAAEDGVRHVEVFFDPQAHLDRGVALKTVLDGIESGLAEGKRAFGISSGLILCFLRHLDEASALAVLEQAAPYSHRLLGVGLDSSENGHPPSKFSRVFARAGAMGLKRVAHAGEEGPPDYVWQALDQLGIDRIDHGNRALEDPLLVERLRRDQMALTVCPLSNLKLKVVRDMAEHPLRRMLDLDLQATVNSDDPAYFGGYVADNYRAVQQALGLSREHLAKLARNSFTASFLDRAEKASAIASLEAYCRAHGVR
ncbi:adenosine deaminase [Limibacillus halophilus]|uniref:Adenine deaminase n=2 Tax=Limibacillus halophilus TaxID=1579333 RepID=A0A839SRZ9_9PROT|nr:adenosine deaminase [Limibacillus halophilus]